MSDHELLQRSPPNGRIGLRHVQLEVALANDGAKAEGLAQFALFNASPLSPAKLDIYSGWNAKPGGSEDFLQAVNVAAANRSCRQASRDLPRGLHSQVDIFSSRVSDFGPPRRPGPNMSNHELLHRYLHEDSQDAFAALVSRHVDLVYSAALRQVRSPHLAEEVAQAVFVDLARQARTLPADQPLSAWLYVVTRRTAIDVVRREARRREGEQSATLLATMRTESTGWTEIAALLDEAMAALEPNDRSAILLRYFENLSLREVGETLGISEDTAQKRVSRAVDRLRSFFDRRGVAVSGAAFAATLATNAVQAAPAGLAAAISSSTAALPSVAAAAAKQLAMTTAQKTLATLAVAAALGLALYEAIPAVRLHAQVQEGQQQLDRLADTARQLRLEQTVAARELDRLNRSRSGAPAAPEPGSDAALAQEAAAWSARIARLKQEFAQHPELAIPELQLLTDRDWIGAAYNEGAYFEKDLPANLLFLRTRAKGHFVDRVSDAARKYFASAHALPDQFDQLAPWLTPPIDPAILARYDFQSENGLLVVAEKLSGALDLDRLTLFAAANSGAKRGLDAYAGWETAEERTLREAAQAYVRLHDGTRPTDPAQLLPFLSQPVDATKLANVLRRLPRSHTSAIAPKS